MGKKSRTKRERKNRGVEHIDAPIWLDDEGANAICVGQPPSMLETAAMTEAYQKQIRNSALWDQMVKNFGEQKAKEMLKEFKVKIDKAP